MINIRMDKTIHSTHVMDEWGSDIIDLPQMSDARFGKSRKCTECGYEEAFAGGAGSHWIDEELLEVCEMWWADNHGGESPHQEGCEKEHGVDELCDE